MKTLGHCELLCVVVLAHLAHAEPGVFGDSSQPQQPQQPGQPQQPCQPCQPGQPGRPEQSGQPTQPGQPGQPGPTEKPLQTGQPEQPGQPQCILYQGTGDDDLGNRKKGRFDLRRPDDRAFETDLHVRTMIIPSRYDNEPGQCYCSCDLHNKPVFISVDPRRLT